MIPAFAVIWHSAARHRESTMSQIEENALATARSIAVEQERFFENAHRFLLIVSRVPQIRSDNKAICSRFFSELVEPVYTDFGIADLNGNLVCSALRPGSSLVEPKGSHYDTALKTHQFAVGKIRTDAVTGKAVINVAFPLLESAGVLRGVLIAVLDFSWITRLTAQNHLSERAAFMLVDSHGRALIRYPEGGDWIGKPVFADPADQPEILEKTLQTTGADGVRRLFAFTQLKSSVAGQRLYSVVDIPAQDAFAVADRILLHDVTLLGLLAALTLAAAWLASDLFVLRRIRDIIATTQQLAAGNLRARTRLPYGRSELGRMARAFDELAQALEKREAEALVAAREIHEQRQRQNALYDLNLTITSSLDLSSVLHTLLEELSRFFPSCATAVSWNNRESGALELIARHNLDCGDRTTADVSTEEGLASLVLTCQSPLYIGNAQVDPRTTNPEFFRRHRLFSYLGMPLISKGETLGVLSFYTKEERRFTDEEMDFLTALANQAAIAIFNSRLYEQTRKQAIELSKSNKIKDEFLGVMSHELRTPLNIIMNYAEALTMGTFGNISAEQERGTAKIRAQAVHLLNLINGILEITKIESGTVSLQKEPLDLAAFMAENRSDYVMPMEKEVTLSWDFPPDLPTVIGDRTKLQQILTNLVDNAIKFTDHGVIKVSMQIGDKGDLEIKVTDTGFGIPEEMLPLIFDKFRQIDGTTTRNFSGAGLGLYIVKTFVDVLAGTIAVQSRLGKGSTFIVHVPIDRATGILQTPPSTATAPSRDFNS
jgi:signal transduction histidine kinase/HAMP domain-containing protein